jgi:hypothetical protein
MESGSPFAQEMRQSKAAQLTASDCPTAQQQAQGLPILAFVILD